MRVTHPLIAVCLGTLVICAAPTVDATTRQCETTVSHSDHWYSPVTENAANRAPDQCATCEDPANWPNRACIVYRILQSTSCADGYCTNEQGEIVLDAANGVALQRSLRHEHPIKFWFDAANNCWFILWATEPATGSEHAGAREQRPYWQAALEAAQTQVQPPIAESELALLMHAANRRSQHQLHIHIGRLAPDYREALDQAERSTQATEGSVIMNFDGIEARARMVPDTPGKTALEDIDVFGYVQDMLPNEAADMPRHTIMLARSTTQAGTWILASGDLTRRVLDFSQHHSCKLASQLQPEPPSQ